MVEGYSRALSSCGFWPGGAKEGAFYTYAYPEPEGFSAHRVEPSTAYYSHEHKEFLLPYAAVRTADDPDHAVARSCRPRTGRPPNSPAGTEAHSKTTRTVWHCGPCTAVSQSSGRRCPEGLNMAANALHGNAIGAESVCCPPRRYLVMTV